MNKNLKKKIADYVVDYPRFEESANEVAKLILDVLRDEVISVIKSKKGEFTPSGMAFFGISCVEEEMGKMFDEK